MLLMDNPRGKGGGQVKASPRQQRATLTKSSNAKLRATEPPGGRRKSQTEGHVLPWLVSPEADLNADLPTSARREQQQQPPSPSYSDDQDHARVSRRSSAASRHSGNSSIGDRRASFGGGGGVHEEKGYADDFEAEEEEDGATFAADTDGDSSSPWGGSVWFGEKDAVEKGFKDCRSTVGGLRKRDGIKAIQGELQQLDTRLRRLETTVMAERRTAAKKQQESARTKAALQRQAKEVRVMLNDTMKQAAEDVLLLTSKLKVSEQTVQQLRVDREHLRGGFEAETAARARKTQHIQEGVNQWRLELDAMAVKFAAGESKVREMARDKAEADKENAALRAQVQGLEERAQEGKRNEQRLHAKVVELEGGLFREKEGLRLEVDKRRKDREEADQAMLEIQVELEAAKAEACRLPAIQTQNQHLKRALAQAQSLLDEAEQVRRTALVAAAESSKRETEELTSKYEAQVEDLRRQLRVTKEKLAASIKSAEEEGLQLAEELKQSHLREAEVVRAKEEAQEMLLRHGTSLEGHNQALHTQLSETLRELQEKSAALEKVQSREGDATTTSQRKYNELQAEKQEVEVKLAEAQRGAARAEEALGRAMQELREARGEVERKQREMEEG